MHVLSGLVLVLLHSLQLQYNYKKRRLRHMTVCCNVHALPHGPFLALSFILTANEVFISSIAVLPSGFDVF